MNPTIGEILAWVDNLPSSADQIQKAYDWRISQWATFGNAVITALFALLLSAVVEWYKEPMKYPHFWLIVAGNASSYLVAYALCRFRIATLQREFIALYTLLAVLK